MTRLCDLSVDGDTVTSVSWSDRVRVTAVNTYSPVLRCCRSVSVSFGKKCTFTCFARTTAKWQHCGKVVITDSG